jgi:hypothetical protein
LTALAEALHRFEPPWIEVARVYRRVCFLRLGGLAEEAQGIEDTELAGAMAKARAASGSEADSILEGLLAEERERVAGAVAFAEVLVPMLDRRPQGPSPASPASPAPRRARIPAHDASRGIADFIDDMLAQERTGTP